MTYKIVFLQSAKKEWDKLSPEIQKHFKNKLAKIIVSPYIPKAKLIGMEKCYKITLSSIGYRLVYKAIEEKIIIQIIIIGKRDKLSVYKIAHKRTQTKKQEKQRKIVTRKS